MPWTPADALHHTRKASTPRLQQLWADTANGVLASTGDDVTAIRKANAAVHRETPSGRRMAKRQRDAAIKRKPPKEGWLRFV